MQPERAEILQYGSLSPTGARKAGLVAIPGQRCAPVVSMPAYYFAAFAKFPKKRLITVGKFERHMKDHLSMSHKLRFRILRCNRNDTFLRAFVNFCRFLAFARRPNVKDRTPSPPVSVADR